MRANLLEVSDSIRALQQLFKMHSVIHLNEEGVAEVTKELQRIFEAARALENEVSAKRWNQYGDPDPAFQTAKVLDAITRPGTNVKLFPVVPRPAFSDGNPKGAA